MESFVLSVNNVTHADFRRSEKDESEANYSKDLEPYHHISSSDNNNVLTAGKPNAILTPEDLKLFKKAEVRKRI